MMPEENLESRVKSLEFRVRVLESRPATGADKQEFSACCRAVIRKGTDFGAPWWRCSGCGRTLPARTPRTFERKA